MHLKFIIKNIILFVFIIVMMALIINSGGEELWWDNDWKSLSNNKMTFVMGVGGGRWWCGYGDVGEYHKFTMWRKFFFVYVKILFF
jgi:hypothetical protein